MDNNMSISNLSTKLSKNPHPGKISALFNVSYNDLYHKFNPRGYDGGNKMFGSDQPYIYRYPGDSNNSIGGQGLPLGQGTDDVVRVTKFVASGRGILFIGKQFWLQGNQIFDETNLYNPTEVIQATVSNLAGGLLDKPLRHIDKTGGLLGGLAALIGISVNKGSPPPSTVAGSNGETEVLPVSNYGNATGLLRAKTALKAKSILEYKWGISSGGGSAGKGILGFVKNVASSVFPQLFSAGSQAGIKQRADEKAYDLMVSFYNSTTANELISTSKLSISFLGFNIKGGNNTLTPRQKTKTEDLYKQKYYKDVTGTNNIYNENYYAKGENDENSQMKETFDPSMHKTDDDNIQKQKNSYFDEQSWTVKKPVEESSYKKYIVDNKNVTSRELVEESDYVKKYNGETSIYSIHFNNDQSKLSNTPHPNRNTKLNEASKPDDPAVVINDNLKRVINNINNTNDKLYSINFSNNDTRVLSSGNTSKNGYDRLHDISKYSEENIGLTINAVDSIRRTYIDDNTRTLDSIINPNKNYGFSGNGRPDTINTLTVLDKDKSIKEKLIKNYTEWKPYDDDLIAFFFYDVVNEKYIPFRATIKGISEANNAMWDELRFIGRGDSLYSYSGYSRNLSFSFNVVINSIVELYPTWKRLNYLAGFVKPSNYTKKVQNDGITNKFIIPPMIMLTIGDLYKYHPIIINTVVINVPENAVWELTPENSSEEWSYLSKIVKTSVSKGKIGQLPREAEVSITCNVLEKERALMGGNHFGHAVKSQLFVEGNTEHLQYPEELSKNIRTVTLAEVDD